MSVPRHWRVFITPLESKNVYGTEIEVTESVELTGLSDIKAGVDTKDFDLGSFLYSFVKMKGLNFDGIFSMPGDSRSMFHFRRDKAKVRITFSQDEVETLTFQGIINEESTKEDPQKQEVNFTILSNDSSIRKTKITPGAVGNGTLFSDAIKTILNVPDITSVINFSVSDVAVGLDLAVDVGSFFDNKNTKEALDKLLIVSSSVLIVDTDLNKIIVRKRDANASAGVRQLFGANAAQEQNIITIKSIKSGFSRMFNTVAINDTTATNDAYASEFSASVKEYTFEFLTAAATELAVGQAIVNEFKTPKMEIEVEVPFELSKDWDFFDPVILDVPYRHVPAAGEDHLPLFDQAVFGTDKFPFIRGGVKFTPNIGFKIVGIKIDPDKFITTLRLREVGNALGDSGISGVASVFGIAIFGESLYTEDASSVDPNEQSVFGAATFGVTKFGT